ncbi:MAG: Rnf-Nqr domain containing protein [Candidatus Hadarchaeota archaeon]
MSENLLAIAISAALINNIILTRFLGLCSFFGVSTKLKNSMMMGLAVTFVMVSSSVITWAIYQLVLVPLQIQYLRLVVFILVIASFVQLLEMVITKVSPALHKGFGIYLPLITVNCAILGITLINVEVERYSFLGSTVSSVATGLGYSLAILLMASIRTRLELYEQPKSFHNLPLAFIVAAILAMAFQGFSGMGR